MSLSDIETEGFFWVQWLHQNQYVARPPSPGRWLQIAAYLCEIAGVAMTALGLLGLIRPPLGDVATWGGAGVMAVGAYISNLARSAVRSDGDAVDLVRIRLDELTREADRIAEGQRQP